MCKSFIAKVLESIDLFLQSPPPPKQDLSYINSTFLPVEYQIVDLLLYRGLSVERFNVSKANCENSPFFGHPELWTAAYSEFRRSQYTGFIASFYDDGQLAAFSYCINGRCYESTQFELSHGVQSGSCGASNPELSYAGESYAHGKTESVCAWGETKPKPRDFQEWVEESISDVVAAGNRAMQNRQ